MILLDELPQKTFRKTERRKYLQAQLLNDNFLVHVYILIYFIYYWTETTVVTLVCQNNFC